MFSESVNNSSLFSGSGILVFKLSLVIKLEVSIIVLIGLILWPAKNLANKYNKTTIIGNVINRIFLRIDTISKSSKDMATTT